MDGVGIRDVSMTEGQIHRAAFHQQAEAVGAACSLVQEGTDRLCVRFAEGGRWVMEPRGVRPFLGALNALDRLILGSAQFRCVALAPDGSRVAAVWTEWEPTGNPSLPYRRGPSHLLVWRRGDRLPSLDLRWEGEDPRALDFTPSAKGILARMGAESLLLDPDTGRETAVIPTREAPACWVPGQDKAIFLVDPASRTYALWDLAWGEETLRFRLPAQAGSAPEPAGPEEEPYLSGPRAISPDGRWIACTLSGPRDWSVSQVLIFELES
jgi:hypothetical protein